jgi:hypothetical protein
VVPIYLAVPLFFLVTSVIPVFADTGSVTIVLGKTYNIGYTSTGVKITDAQADQSLGEILFTVQVLQNNATLQITLPRELIDSKNSNGTDSDFLVVVDGVLAKAHETDTSTTRILQFTNLTTDEKEIDVIGTYLASSTAVSQTSPTQPTQNQTPKIPTPLPTQKVPPPTSTLTIPTNLTQEKNFIQQNINNIISKIPYLASLTNRLSVIDYAVISSIALVIIIVIASTARKKSNKLSRKRHRQS